MNEPGDALLPDLSDVRLDELRATDNPQLAAAMRRVVDELDDGSDVLSAFQSFGAEG